MFLTLSVLITVSCFNTGCTKTINEKALDDLPPVQGDNIEVTDYSKEDNWSALPEGNSEIDVFCLNPTSYLGSEGKLSSIENQTMRKGADDFVKNRASAFQAAGNIYAPYYRQLDANWFLTLPEDEYKKFVLGVPKADVDAAFKYYIENYNDGKPFILVGHSQGGMMIKELLQGYLQKHPDVMERMVAAYILGYHVTKEDIKANSNMKFAEKEDDTGVIISYNTVSPNTDLKKLAVWKDGSLAINPISWTRGGETALAKDGLGSYVKVGDDYEKVKGLADATVDLEKGVVICNSLNENQRREYSMSSKRSSIFSNESYHSNDIPFYYYNLQENAQKRAQAFLSSY